MASAGSGSEAPPSADAGGSDPGDPGGGGGAQHVSRAASVAYSSGTIAMASFPAFLASWQLYYFSPPADSGRIVYAGALTISIVNLIGQIVHSVADGVIGHASDRTRSRWGRRIPWVVISAPICAVSFVAIWWPPSSSNSWVNVVWLVALRAVMWIAYTGAFGPYSSLLAELFQGGKRIRVSVLMALFEVAGMVMATAGAGYIIGAASDGVALGPLLFSDGFKVAATVVSAVSLMAMWLSVAFVKERPHDASKEVPYKLLTALAQTLKNPAFRPYVLAFVSFRIALLAVLTLLPYQVNVVLGMDDAEAAAGTLQMVIVLGSVLLFPAVDRLSRRHGKKRVIRWGFFGFAVIMALAAFVGRLPVGSAMTQAYVLYGCAAFPVATLFVLPRPILADVIDHDAERTGFRREGMYNGVEGMLTKLAEGIGPVVAAGLFAAFGATRAEPLGVILVGPAAAALALLGWWQFRSYPLKG